MRKKRHLDWIALHGKSDRNGTRELDALEDLESNNRSDEIKNHIRGQFIRKSEEMQVSLGSITIEQQEVFVESNYDSLLSLRKNDTFQVIEMSRPPVPTTPCPQSPSDTDENDLHDSSLCPA